MKEEKVIFRKGEMIHLRPVLKEDLEILVIHMNDEETMINLSGVFPISYEDELKWFKDQNKKTTNIVLAVVENSTYKLTGTVGLHGINYIDGTATTGFCLIKRFWSNGYGTEAAQLLLTFAFKHLNLRKINSSVLSFNLRSLRLHMKMGYKEEGVLKKQRYRDGVYVDEILLSLFKKDFL